MIAKVIINNKDANIDQCFDYLIPEEFSGVSVGMRVSVPLGNRHATGVIIGFSESSPFTLKPINKVLDKEPVCSESKINFCLWMKEKYFCSFYQTFRLFTPPQSREKNVRYARLIVPYEEALGSIRKGSYLQTETIEKLKDGAKETPLLNSAVLRTLEKKGIIEFLTKREYREAYDQSKYKKSEKYVPTCEQKAVIDYLDEKIIKGESDTVLLHGVTGSGKTEVFLQAIETCINNGKTAIMLVPEISLTPQMVQRFVSRFGSDVAVIHSKLSPGERLDQWQKIHDGDISVVVGARSAIFAPLENIGIIILDEEHENSYKSDTTPKYLTHDVAKKRCEDENAVLLLASATPSLSTYYKAQSGEYKLFEMLNRYNDIKMPEVNIVDMRGEIFTFRNMSPISLALQSEIRKNLDNKEKTILFLNRRGYSTFVSCRKCGYVVNCPNCDISMTYHKKTDRHVCHYCGHTQGNYTACPECSSPHIRYFGTGTQKIEEELNTLFPDARVLRMDTDTTSKKGGHEEILEKFSKGEADILLGTQMVTKGLDFPDVTLVGVLAADTSLSLDDFRAGERSFSLLTQVCGRAGRGFIPGRAVIQTYQPDNQVIKHAKEHDYKSFYENEIRGRYRMNYPPFCDIVSIIISSDNKEIPEAHIKEVSKFIKEYSKHETGKIYMLGPMEAPVAKINNNYRFRILLKCKKSLDTHSLLSGIYEFHKKLKGKSYISIDINPTNMI